jgi:serine/threonine protein kinase
VAVKRYNPFTYQQEYFLREVEILVRLNHPCVSRILGWSLPDHSTMAEIQFEHARGGSLLQALKGRENGIFREFWNPTGKAKITLGIVLGMRYIHSQAVMHRALAPRNIWLDEHGCPLIANFEQSRIVEPSTMTTNNANVCYAAPEIFDDNYYTIAIDVFSFGSVLLEILTEQPAFSVMMSPLPILKRVCTGQMPPVPGSCGQFCQRLIQECWNREPEKRPTFAQIYERIEREGFDFVPGADPIAVGNYGHAVTRWETRHLNRV